MTRYPSLQAFIATHKVLRGKRNTDDWRLTPALTGEIHALPGSRGTLVATNGILCYIERGDGSLFLGHYDFFTPDGVEDTVFKPRRSPLASRLALEYA